MMTIVVTIHGIEWQEYSNLRTKSKWTTEQEEQRNIVAAMNKNT